MKHSASGEASERDADDAAFLAALGQRVRLLRARRGLTRKALAAEASVSERHLSNLETGAGNASVLILRQVAGALGSTVAEIVGDEAAASAGWLRVRELLRGRDEDELARALVALTHLFEDRRRDPGRRERIALVGLRGAGKSTLGRMIASEFAMPFVELSSEIEKLAGCPQSEIHDLYGPTAYRRYELRALESVLGQHPRLVLATPGGIVTEPGTLHLLLDRCFTVWLQASPEEHMRRVAAQGDLRPMAASREAMDDLKSILVSRIDLYARADLAFDTGGLSLGEAFLRLRDRLTAALGR